jgi:tRNA pseudouridine55 synthase
MKFGFILIDKPKGMSSHDIVKQLRKVTKIKKIGHAGTLDPIATGLLILGIGRDATKKLDKFKNLDKEYIAKIKLGSLSETFDTEGKIEERKVEKIPSKGEIEEVLKEFVGKIKQVPPPFSAKKIKGKKAYELARKRLNVNLKPVEVEIKEIEILEYKWPYLKIKVRCSAGTYIRSLANDIGEKLNCGGLIEELRRTKIGNLSVERAKNISEINSKNWQNFLFYD